MGFQLELSLELQVRDALTGELGEARKEPRSPDQSRDAPSLSHQQHLLLHHHLAVANCTLLTQQHHSTRFKEFPTIRTLPNIRSQPDSTPVETSNMATPLLDPFPTYWRVMGLSVAVSFAGLGTFAMIAPKKSAEVLGMTTSNKEADEVASNSMVFLGARDFSFATALAAFYYQEDPHAMGTVIMSSMILCAVDCIWTYKLTRDSRGPVLGIGVAIWAYIGMGLLKL